RGGRGSPPPRYDRGGGRGGYDDDRHHRHRASDWPDSRFGAPNDGPGNTQREGLMTYKQFIQVLEDDVSPAEAESRVPRVQDGVHHYPETCLF
uniref:Uncharacterized protein n=1 Tax=Aegilops tauschii subsp. strangulata TaxID=200361 RepID=A0A453SQC8_AEGTS